MRIQDENKNLKIFLVLFAAVIVSLSFTTYFFYQEILDKNAVISNLQKTIQEQLSLIENNTKTISQLNSDLQSKKILIDNLSGRLGIAQTEIQQLTPTIKDYYAVGVGSDNKGVIIPLEVKIAKGTGIISVNIKNVDLLAGVQESVRTAVEVAQDQTQTGLGSKDITVSFINNGNNIVTIDGPSAGAAITTTIIAAVENKTLNGKILMTGTIESDGSIGWVGGVDEKAIAAMNYGVKTFLVPFGQKVFISGIDIVEVKQISEATKLVLQ